jgi:glycosyltransferase involved in cell wall biosynthesis
VSASLAVVISTYNAPQMLRLVLNGYARQTDPEFSIYIADDGSGPATQQIIEGFRQQHPAMAVHHVHHEDNGFRKARIHNRVIAQAREDYMLLTDGDCIPLPGLIAAHRRLAAGGTFVSGSRVLISQKQSQTLQQENGEVDLRLGSLLRWRLQGNINRLLPLLLPVYASSPHDRLHGIRGCHLACWRCDLLTVNGFDESFEGWGREDSDLAARLLHAGIHRRDMRGSPVLHLWHKEESRRRLDENDDMLRQCLKQKRIRAIKGIEQL